MPSLLVDAMSETGLVVVVTGTSSGIGRHAVHHLARAGCVVVATARDPKAIADLAGPRVSCEKLDVTSEADRTRVVAGTLSRFGRIDALVNNAGHGAMLAMEDTSRAAMRRMFDTNVFGLHALARAVMPAMRAQGQGRIVNVGSIAGRVAVPLMGSYCATKFAVRALTNALDMEARQFGIRAILIEPGVIRTDFGTRSLGETRREVDVESSPYASMYAKWAQRRARRKGAHPDIIAARIVRACTSRWPRGNYVAPSHAKAARLGKRLLPDSAIHAGLRAYFR